MEKIWSTAATLHRGHQLWWGSWRMYRRPKVPQLTGGDGIGLQLVWLPILIHTICDHTDRLPLVLQHLPPYEDHLSGRVVVGETSVEILRRHCPTQGSLGRTFWAPPPHPASWRSSPASPSSLLVHAMREGERWEGEGERRRRGRDSGADSAGADREGERVVGVAAMELG